MTISKFILSIIEIPDIHPTVFSGKEKYTRSSGGEATVGQVSAVISSTNDRRFQFFEPNFSSPISYGKEVALIGNGSI